MTRYSSVEVQETVEQVQRCLLKLRIPEIQEVLLDGGMVTRLDPFVITLDVNKESISIVLNPGFEYLCPSTAKLAVWSRPKPYTLILIRSSIAYLIKEMKEKGRLQKTVNGDLTLRLQEEIPSVSNCIDRVQKRYSHIKLQNCDKKKQSRKNAKDFFKNYKPEDVIPQLKQFFISDNQVCLLIGRYTKGKLESLRETTKAAGLEIEYVQVRDLEDELQQFLVNRLTSSYTKSTSLSSFESGWSMNDRTVARYIGNKKVVIVSAQSYLASFCVGASNPQSLLNQRFVFPKQETHW